jgi:hypothetical protein
MSQETKSIRIDSDSAGRQVKGSTGALAEEPSLRQPEKGTGGRGSELDLGDLLSHCLNAGADLFQCAFYTKPQCCLEYREVIIPGDIPKPSGLRIGNEGDIQDWHRRNVTDEDYEDLMALVDPTIPEHSRGTECEDQSPKTGGQKGREQAVNLGFRTGCGTSPARVDTASWLLANGFAGKESTGRQMTKKCFLGCRFLDNRRNPLEVAIRQRDVDIVKDLIQNYGFLHEEAMHIASANKKKNAAMIQKLKCLDA